jgi:hypothetical protein
MGKTGFELPLMRCIGKVALFAYSAFAKEQFNVQLATCSNFHCYRVGVRLRRAMYIRGFQSI